MHFELFIGGRYLKTRQKQSFLTFITILSIAGVMVGVMALIVVMAVMAGFESDLKSRILGVESHVVLGRYNGQFADYRNVLNQVLAMEDVEAATPYIYSQVMLRSSAGVSGAILRGILPDSAGSVIQSFNGTSLEERFTVEPKENENKACPGIILGKELARNIGVIKGDTVYLISPRGMLSPMGHIPAMKRFQVTDYFESGMYEYDGSFAYVHLKDAQKILRMGDTVTGIEIRVNDIYDAKRDR